MTQITTISEFLLEAGTDYRIIDMGRAFRVIESQAFLDIENGVVLPQYPRQQMMWLGILFWNKNLSQQQYIWFVKLPLDEQGQLVTAQRDQFLQIILEALGTEMLQSDEEKSLPDNPFLFTPTQQQLADFNALSKALLNLPVGDYYHNAKNYIARPDIQDWQQVALQGISDVAFHLNKDHNQTHICQKFEQYSEAVKSSLLSSLENVAISRDLSLFLLAELEKSSPSLPEYNYLLRALSQSHQHEAIKTFLAKQLNAGSLTQDNLVVIAGRHWQCFADYALLTLLMEQSVQLGIFTSLYADLVQIPMLRANLLKRIRDPERSELISQGLNQLFRRGK